MKNSIRIFGMIFLILTLALTACSQQSEPAATKEGGGQATPDASVNPSALKIATLSQGSSWYVYGATMAEMFREHVEGIKSVDVLPYSGGLGNVKIVSQGEAELGLTFSVNNRWAADGNVAYEEKVDNIRALVGGLDDYYVGIIMTNDFIKKHNVTSLADIKEKKLPVRLLTINVGSQGEFAARQVFEAYGLTYDDLKSFGGSVNHTSFEVVKSSIKDNKADMFIQVMTKGHPSFTEIALQSPVTFMSIEDENAEKLKKYGNLRAVLPANVYAGQTQEVQTIGFQTSLVANASLSEELAYQITKTLVEKKDQLIAGHNALSAFDPEKGIQPDVYGGIELHPGAAKYYKEKGWLK
ncbi:TAXI family TRAP transporter solute-binding subunit [Ammoniphilus sp. YIM 78166]|uniref:TAXI family TRAP transporter solute-binding subunit n=1 Tax=Ammoniphilus sp. YIM 78166 TaxID=1644106 RepID=UPI001430457F|nr:TAXI family TRAP transporter solute-binding subunit [Ammoniphilus sp. YIM 78166]